MKSNIKRLTIVSIAGFVGLVEVANAFYDPGLQRWVNRDPIGERGGINLNSFVANKPTLYVDFLGLEFVVDEKCKADFDKARKYLEKSATAKEMLDCMEKSETKFKIEPTTGPTRANTETDTAIWNPREANKTNSGKGQSPALGLLHELRHLDQQSRSEQPVVEWENTCADELGEGTRENHWDSEQTFEVDDPTKSGPVPPNRTIELPKSPILKPN